MRARSAASTGARLRAHAAPEREGLGRLLDQHAQAVARRARRRPAQAMKPAAAGPYIMSTASAPGCEHARPRPARRRRPGCVARGVDHDVEAGAGVVERAAPRSATPCAQRQRGMPLRPAPSALAERAVGHHDCGARRPRAAARARRPPRRRRRSAARARRASATPALRCDVAHQADAVGVVAVPAVGVEAQHVARRRASAARALSARRQRERPRT